MFRLFLTRHLLFLFVACAVFSAWASEKLMHEQKYETMAERADKDFANQKIRRGVAILATRFPVVIANLIALYDGDPRFAKMNTLNYFAPVVHLGVRKDGTLEAGSTKCPSVCIYDLSQSKGKERVGKENSRSAYSSLQWKWDLSNKTYLERNLSAGEIDYYNFSLPEGKIRTTIDCEHSLKWVGRLSNGHFVFGCGRGVAGPRVGILIYDVNSETGPKEVDRLLQDYGSYDGLVLPSDRIVSGGYDGTLCVWDPKQPKDKQLVTTCKLKFESYVFDDMKLLDHERVIARSRHPEWHSPEDALHIFDFSRPKGQELIATLHCKNHINCFALLPGKRIAAGSGDDQLRGKDNQPGFIDIWQEVPSHLGMLLQKYGQLSEEEKLRENEEALQEQADDFLKTRVVRSWLSFAQKRSKWQIQKVKAAAFYYDNTGMKFLTALNESAKKQKNMHDEEYEIAKLHDEVRLETKCLKLWQQKTKEQQLEKDLNKKADKFYAWHHTRNAFKSFGLAVKEHKEHRLQQEKVADNYYINHRNTRTMKVWKNLADQQKKLKELDNQEDQQLKKFNKYRDSKKAWSVTVDKFKRLGASALLGAAAGLGIYKLGNWLMNR